MTSQKPEKEIFEEVRDWSKPPSPFNTGWQCPKCGNCYSPTHSECYNFNRYEWRAM